MVAVPLFAGLLWLALYAVWAYAAWWVYRDAEARGSNHETAWGVGVLVTGFVGVVLYFAVRTDIGTRPA